MLSPSQVGVGTLADAKGTVLMLPRGKYEHTVLVVPDAGGQRAIFLEDARFRTFICTDNTSYYGMLVPDVRVEIDETSAFPAESYAFLGTLVRTGTDLKLCTSPQEQFSTGRTFKASVATGLPACGGNYSVGFSRWQVVVGEGRDKQVLHKVDIAMPAELP